MIPALVVTVVGFSTAHAADSPAANRPAPFGMKYIGEGGGYKHPDGDVSKYLEANPETSPEHKPANPIPPKVAPAKAEPAKAEPAKVAPAVKPVATAPSRPRPRPFAPALVKSEEATRAPALSPKAAAAEDAPLDTASADARNDYESRLLGIDPGPRRPELADPADSPSANRSVSPVATGEGMLFVSLELEPKEAAGLRDAVAGLGASAAFRADPRFQPLPGPGGTVRISGWLPAARLSDAIARPGVRRVEVERGSRPAGDQRVTGGYLLTLRVADAAHPEESVAESVRELGVETGFKLDRVFGFEAAPGGGKTALVSGRMPVSRLSRALGLRGVIKIVSALPESAPASVGSPAATDETPDKKPGFLGFVLSRSLWLVLLTALLALPTVGRMLGRALAVFVPYR